MEHYNTWHLHKPHFKQSQSSLTFFTKKESRQAGIEVVLKEKHEIWKTSVVHKGRRDEVEKYYKNFQRNSGRKILENFNQNPKWKNIESDRETETGCI